MDWSTFIRISHIVGTALGVGGATLLEIFSIKFLKDQKVDAFEHDVLKVCISLVRIGLVILTFSGMGLLILWRTNMRGPDVFFSDRSLAKVIVLFVLLGVAFLMNFRMIDMKIGSAVSTASWYAAMFLGMMRRTSWSLFELLLLYIVLIFVTFLTLEFFRSRSLKT